MQDLYWVPLFLTLWPWPYSLTYFFKTLTLLITFEQWDSAWLLWYFTCHWVFYSSKPFRVYKHFWHCDLDLGIWPFLWKKPFYLLINVTFKQWVLEIWYFIWVFLVTEPFQENQHISYPDFDLGVRPTFFWKLVHC